MERRAVIALVVVEDAHDPGVIDRVRGVAFAHEARARVGIRGDFRMQDLQRDAMAVAVHREVHGRHSANAEDALDLVLVVQRRADATLRALLGCSGGIGHDGMVAQSAPVNVAATYVGGQRLAIERA